MTEFVAKFKTGPMALTLRWCRGAKFSELVAAKDGSKGKSDLYEGSIIRCIRRLEELVSELASVCKVLVPPPRARAGPDRPEPLPIARKLSGRSQACDRLGLGRAPLGARTLAARRPARSTQPRAGWETNPCEHRSNKSM